MKAYGLKFIISLVAFVAVVGGIFVYVSKSGGGTSSTSTSQASVTVTPVTPVTSIPAQQAPAASNAVSDTPVDTATAKSTKYKDGTYTATGSYMSPGGNESLTVSLTLRGDIVADAAITPGANDGTSRRYQQMFISGCRQYVVGMSVDSIHLGRISGSSLTAGGFNAALSKIKTQAQA